MRDADRQNHRLGHRPSKAEATPSDFELILGNCPGRVVRGSSWTADSDQDLDVLEERLDDVPMVLFGG